MEFGTMAGIGGIFVAVIVSMVLEGSSPMAILLLPALFLVFVGTFGAAMAGGLVRDLPTVARHAKKALVGKPLDGQKTIETIVAMADRARRQGLLALEEMIKDVDDPLLRQGIELTVDGTDPEQIEDILEATHRRQACR